MLDMLVGLTLDELKTVHNVMDKVAGSSCPTLPPEFFARLQTPPQLTRSASTSALVDIANKNNRLIYLLNVVRLSSPTQWQGFKEQYFINQDSRQQRQLYELIFGESPEEDTSPEMIMDEIETFMASVWLTDNLASKFFGAISQGAKGAYLLLKAAYTELFNSAIVNQKLVNGHTPLGQLVLMASNQEDPLISLFMKDLIEAGAHIDAPSMGLSPIDVATHPRGMTLLQEARSAVNGLNFSRSGGANHQPADYAQLRAGAEINGIVEEPQVSPSTTSTAPLSRQKK